METGTEFQYACSVTMENKHFIFGGIKHPTQVCFNNLNLNFLILFLRFLSFPAARSVESEIYRLGSCIPPVPPLPELQSLL